MEVFVTGILHSFGNDNSKRRMICSCIWKGFVTGILFTFAIIIVIVVVEVGYVNI